MSKLSQSELGQRIKSVERRLTRRRTRLLDDWSDTTAAAGRTAFKALPVIVAAGAGLATLYFTRRRASLPSRMPSFASFGSRTPEPPRRSVRWASLVGIAGTLLRIGTSPQARALWNGFKRGRQYRRP